jgi:NADPH-dependent curcumin reductase CurA
MEQPAAVVHNRKVVLRGYIDRVPREDDLELVDGGAVALRVPEGAGPAVLLRNIYLSCDPYMRGRMRDFHGSYIPPFKPGSVSSSITIPSSHPLPPFSLRHSRSLFDSLSPLPLRS